jgi:hypothetical protein
LLKQAKPFKRFKKTSRKNTQGLNQPKLDLLQAVSSLSCFNSGHGETHWKAALHVVKYLKGTRDYELELGGT